MNKIIVNKQARRTSMDRSVRAKRNSIAEGSVVALRCACYLVLFIITCSYGRVIVGAIYRTDVCTNV